VYGNCLFPGKHRCDVPAIAFSPDGLRVAAAVDQSGGLFLWDLATHQRLVLARTPTFYSSLSYSRDGTRLAAGSTDGARLFDAATGEEVLSFEMPASALAFLPDGEKLLAVSSDRAVVFHAPPLAEFQNCDWLKEKPSQEAPDYLGPRPPGVRFALPRGAKAR
jgi:WD40 repeat protein